MVQDLDTDSLMTLVARRIGGPPDFGCSCFESSGTNVSIATANP